MCICSLHSTSGLDQGNTSKVAPSIMGWVCVCVCVCVSPHTQADFSFFFDVGGRRRCYVAPERFYTTAATATQNTQTGGSSGAVSGQTGGTGAPGSTAGPSGGGGGGGQEGVQGLGADGVFGSRPTAPLTADMVRYALPRCTHAHTRTYTRGPCRTIC